MEVLNKQPGFCASSRKCGPFSEFRERGGEVLFVFNLTFWLAFLGLNPASGEVISHEYPLKAVFLVNFAHFTDWPTNAFEEPDSPMVIGVLGNDPFGALLDDAVQGETAKGRQFVVKRYRGIEDIKSCHILFISQSETPHLGKIMAALKGKSILTVSDIDGSAYRGVCVRFVTENNKIRLRINIVSLKNADLVVSSQLLRLAEIVSTSPNETSQ